MIERRVPSDRTRFLFEPVDVLIAAFAGALAAIGAFHPSVVPWALTLRLLCVAALPVGIAALRARGPKPGSAGEIVCDFYPVLAVVLVFDSLGPLIQAVNPHDQDARLSAIDRRLFGIDPTAALERFASPFLSDILTVCYALYYFHPIILGALLYKDDKAAGIVGTSRRYRAYAFTMVAVFFVSYVGYFLVPAVGPRYTVRHGGPLPRGPVSAAIDATLDKLETNKRDCFPSGHTMVVTAVLIEASRRSRKTFLGFLPFAVGLVAATVYCRYHYAIDVIAGLLLAFLVTPLARRFVQPATAVNAFPKTR
jgi:membrane-associated phospholipid phosphatase